VIQTKTEPEVNKSPFSAQAKRRIGFDNEKAQFRAVLEQLEGGQNVRKLRGYPILFDVIGTPWRGSQWVEKIDKRALDGVDLSNLVLLIDHNTTWVLARSGKNMTASVDDTGLFIEATLGDTLIDDYIFDRVDKGIIDGMSFWFDGNAMIATDWENKIDVVLKINEIYEASVVVFPAYEETVIIAQAPEPAPEVPVVVDPEIPVGDADKIQALKNLIAQL
jgi:HK97 family phage prohead protease